MNKYGYSSMYFYLYIYEYITKDVFFSKLFCFMQFFIKGNNYKIFNLCKNTNNKHNNLDNMIRI